MTTSAFSHIPTPAGQMPDEAPEWNRQRPSRMPSHRYADVYSRVDVPLADSARMADPPPGGRSAVGAGRSA